VLTAVRSLTIPSEFKLLGLLKNNNHTTNSYSYNILKIRNF